MIDISAILFPLLEQLWYLVPIFLILLFFKSSLAKGLIGQMLVNLAIKLRLDKKKYHLLKNIIKEKNEK